VAVQPADLVVPERHPPVQVTNQQHLERIRHGWKG
jgi:hypothetical protein